MSSASDLSGVRAKLEALSRKKRKRGKTYSSPSKNVLHDSGKMKVSVKP